MDTHTHTHTHAHTHTHKHTHTHTGTKISWKARKTYYFTVQPGDYFHSTKDFEGYSSAMCSNFIQ